MPGRTLTALSTAFAVSILAIACGGSEAGISSSNEQTGDEQDVRGLKHCAGFLGTVCGSGQTCVDDPIDACDPGRGDKDCGGLCVDLKTAPKCGGIVGLTCAQGLACVDNPSDSCNSSRGDKDCGGVCVKSACDPHIALTVTCKSGTHFDLAKCACVATDPTCDPHIALTATCASGKHFDTAKCACVDNAQICGGIAGLTCPQGFECDLGGANHPDASGTCKKK
jgi:hypothetical protein